MSWFNRKRAPSRDRMVRFFTREGCHLCVDALALLQKYARPYHLKIEIIDIALDPQLERDFGEEIPVVYIDGKKRFFGQVDPVLLLRILNSPPKV